MLFHIANMNISEYATTSLTEFETLKKIIYIAIGLSSNSKFPRNLSFSDGEENGDLPRLTPAEKSFLA